MENDKGCPPSFAVAKLAGGTPESKFERKLKVSIQTFGCQMNIYDTQVAEGFLKKSGYQIFHEHIDDTEKPAPSRIPADFSADIILMNTCAIREHAEDRVFSRLGMLGKAKKKNPNLVVGLMGCMVEEHKEKLFKRFPQLDLMIGTRNIRELPALIEEVTKTRAQVSQIKQDGISIEYSDSVNRNTPFHAWLPIMTGCNKVCTFCIVPITRGSEVSMPAREVYREASRLVSDGVKWITLLGQNVNSYNGNQTIDHRPQTIDKRNAVDYGLSTVGSVVSFPALLEMLCQIEGLERLSFTTSHPHDATRELYEVMARNPKISRRFHLPLQSASDRILKRMKRLHTFEEYKAKIELMREMIPDICITTDIIVGFSGETNEDYEATKRALQEIRYDSAYIYKYSLRPGTPAAKLPDDVPQMIKEARNNELLQIQRAITVANSQPWLGRTVNVFVEEASSKTPGNVIARTDQDKKVVFKGDESLVGQFVKVKLNDLKFETFVGGIVK